MEFAASLDFMPHGMCYLWRPDLLLLHAGSDAIIALSYYSIPLALVALWRRRRGLEHGWIFKLFALFIFACGTTHLISIWNIWNSHYYTEGLVKLGTALVSLATAILIWPLLPKLAAIPSPSVLIQKNAELKEQMALRSRAEQEVNRLNESLEQLVAERTRELEQTKRDLEVQVQEVSQTRKRMQSVFESAPNGMIVIDHSGAILHANETAHSIFGYQSGGLVSNAIEMLVPPGLREGHQDRRSHYIEHPEKRMMGDRKDLYGLRRDNSLVPVEIGLNPIEGNGGGEVVASVVDISERKDYERGIERRNEALERSNRQLEEFAFIASHDLREPLRKIVSFSKLLLTKDYGSFNAQGEEFTAYIVSAAERMRDLLDNLLSYSRVTSKGGDFVKTSLNEVADDVLSDLQISIQEASAQVNVDPLETVKADPSQMRQLLQNLVTNSLKYAHPERDPVIRLSGKRLDNGFYQVQVEDNGLGFDPKYKDRIFEVFRRLHDQKEYEGTGMGLAICRKIVERHGGRLWAGGQPGIGSRFYIELPLWS